MRSVSGSVSYDDGTLIPADRIVVNFLPMAAPLDPATHPRPGAAEVDVTTGKFEFATSHKYADGVVKGKHRVFLMIGAEGKPAEALAPAEYLDASSTPVVYDTSSGVLTLTVPKP